MTGADLAPLLPGAGIGLLGGLGLVLVVARLPVLRRPDLDARLAPYVRDVVRGSRLLPSATAPGSSRWHRLAQPALASAGQVVERLLGGGTSVARRLQRAGQEPDVQAFRSQQVLWGAAGLGAGIVLAALLWWHGDGGPVTGGAMALAGAAFGVAACDHALSRRVQRREQRMLVELPTVAEMLALAVGAGEGAVSALERVCRTAVGELSAELRRTLADARAGASLTDALQGLADRTGLPSLARFVDAMVIAVERGTPLADVLRAQAQDVREEARRSLLEAGGRKEIQMMVPVVLLVLPVTVLFAVFPGLSLLSIDM